MVAHSALRCFSILLASLGLVVGARADTLRLERKILLGDVAGRIDHIAFDRATGRLFVAELGNGSVGVVDVNTGSVQHRIRGLNEPQGVAYIPQRDLLIVASGGTGAVAAYTTSDYSTVWTTQLSDDADNIRADPAAGDMFVGYGRALARLDEDGNVISTARLAGHPESFQLAGDRVFVNVPSARHIAVVGRTSGQVTTWATPAARANFPMAVDAAARQILSVFRDPPRVALYDVDNGKELATTQTCGDADDVWIDHKRSRVYVSCGDGHVAVLARQGSAVREIERVRTIEGARTSLFAPDLDVLFVAARARAAEKAAIWVFRPMD